MTFRLDMCSDRTLLDYIARPEVAERSTGMTLEQLVDEAKRRWLLPIGHSRQAHVDSAWAEYLAGLKRQGKPEVGAPKRAPVTGDADPEAELTLSADMLDGVFPATLRLRMTYPDGACDAVQEYVRKLARARLANELSEATINVLVSRAGQGWPVRDLLTLVDDLASIGVISEGSVEEAKAAVFRAARNYAVDGLIKSDHTPF